MKCTNFENPYDRRGLFRVARRWDPVAFRHSLAWEVIVLSLAVFLGDVFVDEFCAT